MSTHTQSSMYTGTTASRWLQWLDAADDGPLGPVLEQLYGSSQALQRERAALIRSAVHAFRARFGDLPVRVFRAPARINLRGMHVDTHGGYLNLMTHHRETVIAAAPDEPGRITLYNADSAFEPVRFAADPHESPPGLGMDWMEFINSPAVIKERQSAPGHWAHYVRGCHYSLRHRFPGAALPGMRGAVAADIPQGAALSSSASLCTAMLMALLGLGGRALKEHELIRAEQDAEWFTGARTGTSDQAAIILGERGALLNAALRPGQLETSPTSAVPFPADLRVIVVNSFTKRSLSGAHRMAYVRNRFAYSLALDVLRQEMERAGFPEGFVDSIRYLSDLTAAAFAPHGQAALWRLLQAVPGGITLDELKQRYDLPDADQHYAAYFAGFPERERPTAIQLRGPLIFGVAESERARRFPQLLAEGAYETAGRMMTLGHDGDRVVDRDGGPFHPPVDDAALTKLAGEHTPIEECPGGYGASSPALDALVDHALACNALGACLTGAGIAGSVLALCRAEDAEALAQQMAAFVASADFMRTAGLTAQPRAGDKPAVVNHAAAAAGEIQPRTGQP